MKLGLLALVACAASHPASAPAAPARAKPTSPLVGTNRNIGACPTPIGPAPKRVTLVPACPALRHRDLGNAMRPTPERNEPTDPDAVRLDKPLYVVATAAEFRSAFHCEPPTNFDFTAERIAVVVVSSASNAPSGVAAVDTGGAHPIIRISTGQVCQGMTPRSAQDVTLLALPAAMTPVDVESCAMPRRACGPVP
jgi:hypothetical protein